MRELRGLAASLDAVRDRGRIDHDPGVEDAVRTIVRNVRERGDDAVRDATARFDGVTLDDLTIPVESVATAAARLDAPLREAIDLAADRIEAFHRRQPVGGFLEAEGGAVLGQLVRPIERVGVYVPGGTAPLFSSLLMCALPARVAGVPTVVAATPPGPDGTVPAEIRYAAARAGVASLVRAGGAQAIAALAYGTASIPAVDKIVGPGNRYVIEAKRQVFGTVGIEALPGPTETLVIAGPDADPVHVAADLLAQAEHLDARPVLVAWSDALIARVLEELERQLRDLTTADAARASLTERGLLCRVDDLEQAIVVANAHAPEHLCLLVDDPWAVLPQVRNAGGVFLGAHSMEALGDYAAGPSHVMPTMATARFASAVNVRDFQKVVPVVSLSPELVRRIGPAAARMARAEHLEAHARAVETRLDPTD
ncbi:MAG: histidinol dehydrogenase [Trueperaceae bacterium]